ncbi:MAG: hypothetical protein J6X49_17375 [Victivallales bacterium]|nr:hypothetical protein [Victivallales bacterium]
MSGWNRNEICELAMDCARFAVSHRQRAGIGYEYKYDGSLVTAVDARNEDFLKTNLQKLDDGSYFIGEETVLSCGAEYLASALKGRCWVVDPIDGTAPFAHGFPTWGVSIGYMQQGVLTDGAVILPDTREMLVTDGDNVLYTQGFALTDVVAGFKWAALEKPSDIWTDGGMLMLGQKFTREETIALKNPVMSSGSAVQALASVMSGKAEAYLGHMKLWDIGGVLPMMSRLDIVGRMLNGMTMSCDLSNGAFDLDTTSKRCWALNASVWIARPGVLDALSERLS